MNQKLKTYLRNECFDDLKQEIEKIIIEQMKERPSLKIETAPNEAMLYCAQLEGMYLLLKEINNLQEKAFENDSLEKALKIEETISYS